MKRHAVILIALLALFAAGIAAATHQQVIEEHVIPFTIGDVTGEVTITDTDVLPHDTTTPDPPPPSGGYPDASNTGPSGPLTDSTGNITVSTAGAVIQNRRINGCVTVNAANVTIRNSIIECNGGSVVWSGSTGLVIEDSIIECGHRPGTTAVTPRNYTLRRSELFGCENIAWASSNVLIEDSYLHDPICATCWPSPIPHTDSVQVPGSDFSGGTSNITIRHNRIYGGYTNQSDFGNSAITTGGGVSNFLVENNILAGGGATLRCEGQGVNVNYRILNNRFSTVFVPTVGGFFPVNGCLPGSGWPVATVFSGNVIHETGEPVP